MIDRKILSIATPIVLGVVIMLCLACIGVYSKRYKEACHRQLVNEKALEAEKDSLNERIYLYEMSVKELESSNDSLITEMNDIRKKLKIKDKTIKQLQYSLSTAEKTDSIIVRDTIFRDKKFQLDTVLGDKWFNTSVYLRYPSTIKVVPRVTSEKFVYMDTVKKTIDPPKKLFFLRWFQKKYTTVEVTVIEKNPYIKTDRNKYVEIMR